MSSGALSLARSSGRRGWALFALAVLVGLLLAVTATRQAEPVAAPPFALDSAQPTGLLGLVRWLEALGYRVERAGGRELASLPADALLFVYPNQRTYTPAEAVSLREWVAGGGTLFLVAPDGDLAAAFGVYSNPSDTLTIARRQVQPLLPEGRESYWPSLQFPAQTLDLSAASGVVPVLADAAEEVVLAVQALGDGVVWYAAPGVALSNDGLRQNAQGELLPALLRNLPPGGTVVFAAGDFFDMAGAQPIATLQDWLYRTPSGWATLLGLGACVLFLLLQGRRLGPALETTGERPRREAAEHVRALAALARRSQLTQELVEYQRRRLKRGLARRLPVSADLPDAEFMERVRRATPALAPETLAQVDSILAELHPALDERRLVALAAQIDDILRQVGVQTFGAMQ
jgi:hypothetical protein